jgi:calcineurin-like phosphoesterase family protein
MAIFLTSDTHFGHSKILTIEDNGQRIRPFDSLDHMHAALVERWNAVVAPGDTVYHMGDVSMTRQGLQLLESLNGRKVLVRGNHDIYSLKDYARFFADVRGCYVRDGLVFSHIPLHRDCLANERYQGNVHGHLHNHVIVDTDGAPSPFYFNACVERHGFAPVALEEAKAYFSGHGRSAHV